MLHYVYLPDNRMLNEEVVKAGYGQVYIVPPNVEYVERFRRAEREARENKRGCGSNMSNYFSKRNKPFTDEITIGYWSAFKSYIDELGESGWLSKEFGSQGYDFGNYYWIVEKEKVNRKMLQELGKALFPLGNMPSKEYIFDLIEFFFKYVAVPKNDEFDSKKAKYQYTIRINELFGNFKASYQLRKGLIKELHSNILDRVILNDKFNIPDLETHRLLIIAIEKFHSRNINEQKIALEKLVDAYQRISSWEDKDKRKSVGKILEKASGGDERIKKIFGSDLNDLWKIANEFMIRHTEVGKKPITDDNFREYLFYAYYNCLRFMLIKYNYKEDVREDEEMPF